jgi:hypothetical protein
MVALWEGQNKQKAAPSPFTGVHRSKGARKGCGFLAIANPGCGLPARAASRLLALLRQKLPLWQDLSMEGRSPTSASQAAWKDGWHRIWEGTVVIPVVSGGRLWMPPAPLGRRGHALARRQPRGLSRGKRSCDHSPWPCTNGSRRASRALPGIPRPGRRQRPPPQD